MYLSSNPVAPGHNRPAITRAEVLVIVAMLGIVLAMLMAATGKVREAADRSASSNNLKQITLAAISYSDQNNGNLPPVGFIRRTPGHASAHFSILPQLEGRGLGAPPLEDDPRPIKVYLAPNDPTADGRSPGTAKTTSYLCNLHAYGPPNDDPNSGEATPLSAAEGSRYPDDFADGPGHVLSFAEAYSRPRLDSSARNYMTGAGTTFTAADLPRLAAADFGVTGPVCYSGGKLNVSLMDGTVRLVARRVAVSQWRAACLPRDKVNPAWE
jgi:type II secretory pathway pseudopilin PulG